MNTVFSLIIMLSQNSLTHDVTYTICHYIIDHIDEMDQMSIKRLSEECFTSTTSIIKFCQLLGFHSYSEFKRHLFSGVETRKRQLKEKMEFVTIDDIITKIQDLSIKPIDQAAFLKYLDRIIQLIIDNQKIYIYGATFPLALTLSFCEDMGIMGVPVHLCQMSYGHHHISKEKGVYMIITISGRFIEHCRHEYKELCSTHKKTVLISQETEYIGDVSCYLPLPQSKSSEYDEVIFLYVLNLIKVKYYQMKQQ